MLLSLSYCWRDISPECLHHLRDERETSISIEIFFKEFFVDSKKSNSPIYT